MSRLPQWARSTLGIALLLSGLTLARAADGRDFAGYYAISNPQVQGEVVHLTLTLQLFNYSEKDIQNATVLLRQTGAGAGVQGRYARIKQLPQMRDVRLSREFDLPAREYQRWQQGVVPIVSVHYKDASGRSWTKTVELSRRAVLPAS